MGNLQFSFMLKFQNIFNPTEIRKLNDNFGILILILIQSIKILNICFVEVFGKGKRHEKGHEKRNEAKKNSHIFICA